MASQEVKLVPHRMKYVAVPSRIKTETNGVLPHPVCLARICFIRTRQISVVCVVSTVML